MQINWIPTNDYYKQLLNISDAEERRHFYIDHFVTPWQQMMNMIGEGNAGISPDDPLAGAKRWHWLLPDQLEEIENLLAKMETAHAWERGKEALERATSRFADYESQIPFDEVAGWLMLADADKADPLLKGYTGATDWTQPRLIGQFWEANDYNLPRLGGLFAHEFHHLVRLKAFPWSPHTSVADYIVLEGTAEAFAASLYGEDKVGFFISEFDSDAFTVARDLIGNALDKRGFHVIRAYIFGDPMADEWGFEKIGMPAFGGYTVGYHLVKAFLERSGKSIEEATFMPANEIIVGSGMFA